jgi:translation initiation factor 3 subunit B
MAPSFDTLSDHDFQEEDDEEEIDFSDLREQYDVRMEEGLDTFVVCLRIKALPHLADHWAGRRRLANRQLRAKTETGQVSTEEAQHCWED